MERREVTRSGPAARKPSAPETHGPDPAAHTPEQVITVGESVKGTPLEALVLGVGQEDTTVVFGAFHGDEPGSEVVVNALLSFLREHPEKLGHRRRVVIMPVVNPDGLAAGTRQNANGVDLNRNLPTQDWTAKYDKKRYHPGPTAASEPETKAVISLLERYPPDKVISVHTPLNLMNWTGTGELLAAEMKKHNRLRSTGDIGYSTPGSFGTYCGVELGAAMVTLELATASGNGAWARHKDALLAAIQYEVSE
jgi:protein MpaA